MSDETKESVVLAAMALVFLALYAAFMADLWGRVEPLPEIPLVDTAFTNTGTVRISAAETIATDGDTSGMECYSCHDEGQRVKLKLDKQGQVILVPEHKDLVIARLRCPTCHTKEENVELEYDDNFVVKLPAGHTNLVLKHGEFSRNNNCFNCHNPDKMNELVTPQGEKYPLAQSTMLCVSCHGTSYRDWKLGVHGRTSGYWDPKLGPAKREGCASCHDPHNPTFVAMRPAPGPHLLHAPKGHEAHDAGSAEADSSGGESHESKPAAQQEE